MQRLLLIDLLGDNSTPLIDSVIASVKQVTKVNWHMYCLCIVNVSHVYRHISVLCACAMCVLYMSVLFTGFYHSVSQLLRSTRHVWALGGPVRSTPSRRYYR